MSLIEDLAHFEKAADEVLVGADDLREHAFGPKPYVEIIVAERDEQLVGAALFYVKYSTWKGPALHLEDLIVAESERSRGVGSLLLEEVITVARARGYRRVYWQVLDWNVDAIRFYERHGAEMDPHWINAYVDVDARP